MNSDDWNRKVGVYADMRVGPHGVLSLNDRYDELIERVSHKADELQQLRNFGLEIEKQLQSRTVIDMDTIDDEMVEKEFNDLLKIEWS